MTHVTYFASTKQVSSPDGLHVDPCTTVSFHPVAPSPIDAIDSIAIDSIVMRFTSVREGNSRRAVVETKTDGGDEWGTVLPTAASDDLECEYALTLDGRSYRVKSGGDGTVLFVLETPEPIQRLFKVANRDIKSYSIRSQRLLSGYE